MNLKITIPKTWKSKDFNEWTNYINFAVKKYE